MLRTRNSTACVLLSGVVLICLVAPAVAGRDNRSTSADGNAHSSSGWRPVGTTEPKNRQLLPVPTDSGLQPALFGQDEESSQNRDQPDDRSVDDRSDDRADSDVGDEDSQDEEPDLVERVRALEAELASLSGTGEDDEDSLSFRLGNLEETLAEFEGTGSQFVETLARNSRRIVNGRIHLDAWQFPISSPGINAIENGNFAEDPENRTLVRRAHVGVRGTVPPDNISYRLDLEFSGSDGGQIRDAWFGWDELPYLNTVRIGNQKRPYGLDHLNSSNFMTFLERPFIVDAFNRNSRRIGIASYGAAEDLSSNWQFGLFNMVNIQDTNQIVGDNAQLEFAGRRAHTVWYDESSGGRGYAHFALAGTQAFPGGDESENQAVFQSRPEARTEVDWLNTGLITGTTSYRLLAAESVINIGSWQLVSEWMHMWLKRDSGMSDIYLHGGYVSLSYFLTGEHIPWNRQIGIKSRVQPHENFFCLDDCDGCRGTGYGAWQVALRFSTADFNDRDVQGGRGQNLTAALNWYMNANTRWQFNYIWGRIDDRRTTLDNAMTPIVSGSYQIMGSRFVIDF